MNENQQVRVGIGVLIFKEGKILLLKRRGAHGADTWAPPGGHLEFGESFEDTARRETVEETGVSIKNVRFGGATNDHFAEDGKHYVTIWVVGDWHSGEPRITEPEKCSEQRWVSLDDLPSPLFISFENLLASDFINSIKKANATSQL